MLPWQALGKVMEKQEHRDPPCLSQSVWPGGPSNLPLFHCRLPKLLRGRWPPSIGASADPGQDWSWAGISGAYSQGSHGRVAKARPATCCEGWFNKTTLSPTILACLASVNKITGFSWQFSLVLFALCPSPALEGSHSGPAWGRQKASQKQSLAKGFTLCVLCLQRNISSSCSHS